MNLTALSTQDDVFCPQTRSHECQGRAQSASQHCSAALIVRCYILKISTKRIVFTTCTQNIDHLLFCTELMRILQIKVDKTAEMEMFSTFIWRPRQSILAPSQKDHTD
jgi:hypothetical protein